MGTTSRRVQLNLFEVEFSERCVNLPSKRFADDSHATEFLRQQPRSMRAHRVRRADGQTALLVFEGEVTTPDFETETVDLSDEPYLALQLARHAIYRYFRDRGFIVRADKFTLTVREQEPRLKRGAAVVYRGVSLQFTSPFAETASKLSVIATWQTPAEFTRSVADPVLRAMALGQAVIFRSERGERDLGPELRGFRNRFLGRIREFTSSSEAAVYCRDHSVRLLSVDELYLEARPNVLAEYDRRTSTVGTEPIWSQMLKMNHTLSDAGRRNTAVLQNRLVSVREFLGGGNKQKLSLPATKFDDVVISMSLDPLIVPVSSRV